MRLPPTSLQVAPALAAVVLAVAEPGDAQPPPGARPSPASAPEVRGPCALDDRPLSRAAAVLVRTEARLTPDRLAGALRGAGASDVRVRALRVPPGDAPERVRRWLVTQERTGDAPLACGEAVAGDGERVVLASPRGGSLQRVPGPGLRLRVALGPGFRDPELVVEDADGAVRRRPVRPGVTAVEGATARVQLLARGPEGLRPVALLDVGAPAARPRTPPRRSEAAERAPAPPDGPRAPETHAAPRGTVDSAPRPPVGPPAEAVARWRRRAEIGGPPLRRNRLLDRVAHRHAERVCAEGRATHRGDGGDDPEARLRRAGLAARVVGEVVARGHGPRRAAQAVMDSPAHRAVVLDPRFTDLGSALVRRGEDACLVLVFAAWPRAVPPG